MKLWVISWKDVPKFCFVGDEKAAECAAYHWHIEHAVYEGTVRNLSWIEVPVQFVSVCSKHQEPCEICMLQAVMETRSLQEKIDQLHRALRYHNELHGWNATNACDGSKTCWCDACTAGRKRDLGG